MNILLRKSSTAIVVLTVLAAIVAVGIAACQKERGQTEVIGFPQSFADLAAKINPAVVNIATTTTVRIPGNPFRQFFGPDEKGGALDNFFRHHFGDVPDRELRQSSLGSGFIIDKEGYIITNNHVVDGADDIKVRLADGREFKAKVVGRDPKTDLALIKILSIFKDLPVLPLGDSDKIKVGDWVLAAGNPFGLENTVTQGILSAKGRELGEGPFDTFLQTDAPINPGNSGGPLVNLKGEVIGINTAIIAAGQGIGFAIPSNIAKKVIPVLKEKGKIVRGWIGVSIQTVTPEVATALGLKEAAGALVADIAQGGPADKAGITRGDIITSFDGNPINKASDLSALVSQAPSGKDVQVRILRGGKESTVTVKLGES
ncbi:MAG TPA: Do family serine endopeptidase [Dissulfurispiraceae bacterium]|nr:Do family serine endopeptidase [Dissulfurispiraceae bacterium]